MPNSETSPSGDTDHTSESKGTTSKRKAASMTGGFRKALYSGGDASAKSQKASEQSVGGAGSSSVRLDNSQIAMDAWRKARDRAKSDTPADQRVDSSTENHCQIVKEIPQKLFNVFFEKKHNKYVLGNLKSNYIQKNNKDQAALIDSLRKKLYELQNYKAKPNQYITPADKQQASQTLIETHQLLQTFNSTSLPLTAFQYHITQELAKLNNPDNPPTS